MSFNNVIRPLGRVVTLCGLAALSACNTVNPDADIARSRSIAIERIGLQPKTVWNGSDSLTEELSLATAFANNTRVRSALALVARRRAELNQASMPENPSISVGLGIAIDGLSGAPMVVRALEQLSWLWTREHTLNIANAARREAILLAAEEAVALATEVKAAHTRAVAAKERVALEEAFLSTTDQAKRIALRLAEVGEASLLDVERAKQISAEASARLAASRFALLQEKLALLAIIGTPEGATTFEVAGSLGSTTSVPTEEEIIHRAAIVRLDVAAAREAVNVAVAKADRTELRRYPSLDGGLAWQQSFNDRHALVPSVTLNVPIFDDGSSAQGVADANVEIALLALEETKRTAIQDARRALQAWHESREQVTLYRETVLTPALHTEALLQRSHEEGLNDLSLVLRATRGSIDAKRQLLLHQTNLSLHLVSLEQAVGGSFDIPLEPPLADQPNEETPS